MRFGFLVLSYLLEYSKLLTTLIFYIILVLMKRQFIDSGLIASGTFLSAANPQFERYGVPAPLYEEEFQGLTGWTIIHKAASLREDAAHLKAMLTGVQDGHATNPAILLGDSVAERQRARSMIGQLQDQVDIAQGRAERAQRYAEVHAVEQFRAIGSTVIAVAAA